MAAVDRRSPTRTRPAKAPTIFDVAALAGVSKSTVSNVIRGVGGASEATRARVNRAIDQLGYRPNIIARQLVHQRTNTIGVLAGNLDNPFHGEMATRVVQAASQFGMTAVFYDIEGDGRLTLRSVEALLEQHVAGIVFLAIFGSSPAIEYAVGGRVPVVFVGLREDWADSVAVDDHAATVLATRHVIDLGHRRIAYLTTPGVERRTARGRADGYRAAMRAAGLEPRPVVRWDPEHDRAGIGRGAPGPLAGELVGPAAPTAIVCSNDLGAIAVLEVADRLRISVPGQLSVVGFDNVHLAGLARISLTTVSQPLDELARVGIETVVARIQGRENGPVRAVTLPAELVVRESTGRPRARQRPAATAS
ncbi:MAG TPA: LacI family DNA-binding transcriptional regulator [Gaiellales bacterium]|jgi:DNA-binding LacI/PurR family transcriptional regulator|nr:LacI family DNA-binding transcriptional regulator [Gaiellales bacterium]